jgi:prevent-host-death family protein
MRYSTQVKPISYLKANAAEVLDTLAKNRQPLIITQNGEAKAVMQDLATYENTQETLALLKVLALGMQQVEAGQTVGVDEAFAQLKQRLDTTGSMDPAPLATTDKRRRAPSAPRPKANSKRQ